MPQGPGHARSPSKSPPQFPVSSLRLLRSSSGSRVSKRWVRDHIRRSTMPCPAMNLPPCPRRTSCHRQPPTSICYTGGEGYAQEQRDRRRTPRNLMISLKKRVSEHAIVEVSDPTHRSQGACRECWRRFYPNLACHNGLEHAVRSKRLVLHRR